MSVFATTEKSFQQIENKIEILSNQNKAPFKALSVFSLFFKIE